MGTTQVGAAGAVSARSSVPPADTYTVQHGDTLAGIAAREHVSVGDLLAANPQVHNPNVLYPGDRLALPASQEPAAARPAPAASAPSGFETVKRGDTLGSIATSHHLSLAALRAANPQLRDPNAIHIGERINLPEAPAKPAQQPALAPAPAASPVAPVTQAAAASTPGITAEQLHRIMPHADAQRWVGPLNAAMAAHHIDTPAKKAAFLAQVGVESGQLRTTSENLNYSAQRLTQVWPSRFPTLQSAQPYAHNPEKLANHVYANRNGNGNEASGDGWKYRGGGLMQTTGRANYRAAGFEDHPEQLRQDGTAADSAAHFWQSNGLNERAAAPLTRSQFDGVTRTVNGGLTGAQERWQLYQRAQEVLGA